MDEIFPRVKLSLTCSFCSKILKCPIELPCDDLICQEHLKEKEVVQKNKIKCSTCQQVFEVKDHEFNLSKLAHKQIENKIYLSGEELAIKQRMEETFKVFYQKYDEFFLNKSQLSLDCFNHFQEIRFQLDQHREVTKQTIDNMYMKMIEMTKECEATYLKYNEGLEIFSHKLFENKSIDKDLKDLEETFRDPLLLFKSIKEMEQKQQDVICRIRRKLEEMDKVNRQAKALNHFAPILNYRLSDFGFLKLKPNKNDPFDSKILTTLEQQMELIKLCEFNLKDSFRLIYRASEHGFGSHNFHNKCNIAENTFIVIKASETNFIFGGYTSVKWSPAISYYKADPNAFLFSLTNKDNQPCKMKIDSSKQDKAIVNSFEHGPIFGDGHDICIFNFPNKTSDNYSNLGTTFKHPQYAFETNEAKSFLAGSHKFQVSEIEIYEIE